MEGLLAILIIGALVGLIPATIGSRKGGSFVLWWLYGGMFFIVALPHALLMKADRRHVEWRQLMDGMRKCPHCAEMVKAEAKICRYCQRELDGAAPPTPVQPPAPAAPESGRFKTREEYERWKAQQRGG